MSKKNFFERLFICCYKYFLNALISTRDFSQMYTIEIKRNAVEVFTNIKFVLNKRVQDNEYILL